MTPTIQRLAILGYLRRVKSHPTADQTLAAVKKKFPSISRATVYNTLDALTKAGMILRLSVDPTVARYDAYLGPHAHFRCRVCGEVYDIELEKDVRLDEIVEGHRVESVRTYAYGICADCIEKGRDRA
jgi:Fur family peroxide stress response transcriptional regulator